ncbi:UBC-like protein [Artomyces pyxidatus]|uniref:UBC-like protein n=1 Tax=Artomyces pyxidatus TaxID=48021 RepID=A0ACB8TJU8_9AGAM|nr:UBC-like protein [Artomyces pyxidatus]
MLANIGTLDLGTPPRQQRTVSSSVSRKNTAANQIAPDSAITNPVARAAVSLEYASLRYQGHCPLGMYIIPCSDAASMWDAVLFVHQGYYADSILKFRLTFPADYPERAPVVQFMTDVFHPLISQQDGTFNLAPKFKPWRPKEHHAYDVLHCIKAAFKKHALDQVKQSDCLNKEAFRLYHDSTSSFAALATQSSMLSQTASALFDQDHPSMASKGPAHTLVFRELRPEQSAALRARLGLQEWDDEPL